MHVYGCLCGTVIGVDNLTSYIAIPMFNPAIVRHLDTLWQIVNILAAIIHVYLLYAQLVFYSIAIYIANVFSNHAE